MNGGQADKEKRMFSRISRGYTVRFKRRDASSGWNITLIKDLSWSGCYFYSSDPIELGIALDMEVQFPAYTVPMKFGGEVIRCETTKRNKIDVYGVTIKFDQQDSSQRDKFNETINLLLKRINTDQNRQH